MRTARPAPTTPRPRSLKNGRMRTARRSTDNGTKKEPPVVSKAVATISAPDLVAEFKKDRKGTLSKFGGKTIAVEGEVDSTTSGPGSPAIVLKVKGEFLGVDCATIDQEPWAKVVPGQQVTINGDFEADSLSASLIKSVVAKTGPEPRIDRDGSPAYH
jgi:hypothetical protein